MWEDVGEVSHSNEQLQMNMKTYVVTLTFTTEQIDAASEQEAIKIAERAASECGFRVIIKEIESEEVK